MLDEAAYAGPERRWAQDYLRIGSLELPYVSKSNAIGRIDWAIAGGGQICVAFCNANTMLRALDSREYARKLDGFLVLNDGIGVDLCSRLINGRPFEDNLNGTDFTPELLGVTKHDLKLFLLGARPGVAEIAAERLIERFPRHAVVGVRNGYFTAQDVPAIVDQINASGADFVLVGLGNPLQEEFVAANAAALNAPAIMMVGAFFDFIAGRVVRAPAPIRAVRAEWLFRLAQEPRRLGRRYTIDVVRFFAKIGWLKLRQTVAGLDPASGRLRPGN